MKNRGLLVLGVVLLTGLVLYFGYVLCFAFWMLEYPNQDPALRKWETKFWFYGGALIAVLIADIYYAVKLLKRS